MGSSKLSINLTGYINAGNRLNDNSKHSEKILELAINNFVIPYANLKLKHLNGSVHLEKTISLYECQQYYSGSGLEENKHVFMKPDGGILFAKFEDGKKIPILITEDKCQGTNDILFENGKNRQATGNAVERSAKNIRGAEMIFSSQNIFPYLLFASGCDFHHTETISKRFEMMNMGFPNYYIDIIQENQDNSIKLSQIVDKMNIKKHNTFSIASIFIKAHRWDKLKHGSSKWNVEEITQICCKAIDLVIDEIK